MLVKNNEGAEKSVKTEEIKKKKSKLWLIIVLGIFAVFIFLPLYLLLKSGLLYFPAFSDRFFKMAEPSYTVEAAVFNQQTLLNNFTMDAESWHLLVQEKYLAYLLDNYLGEDWQLIVREDEFELYGPLVSALNNPDQKSYVRVDYKVDDGVRVFLNDLLLPQFISDYLIKKYLLVDEIDDKYFKELILKEGAIEFVGDAAPWQEVLNNLDYDSLMKQVINYFIES